MGFRRGFAGGITLTIGILYLTVKSPKHDRQGQTIALSSQSHLRNSFCRLRNQKFHGNTLSLARDNVSKSFVEILKSRWNEEVEKIAWWINQKDWNEVRYEVEKLVINIMKRSDEQSEVTQSNESKSLSELHEAVDKGKAAINNSMATMKDGAKAKVKDIIKATETLKTDAHEAIIDSIDNALDREKDSVISTREKTSSALVSPFSSLPGTIEETLQKRYAKSTSKKSVEETLEERYKPIDKNDLNT